MYLRHLAGIGVFLLSASFWGCGNDSGFSGESGTKKSEDAKAVIPDVVDDVVEPVDGVVPYSGLTWFWQCTSNPVPTPAAKPTEQVLEGTGPHKIDHEKLKGTPITFSGHLCEPKELSRDIVFVVDVSGSMNQNDPRVGDSCGRLQAIESVMASVTNGNANFSIVTFGTLLTRSSTTFFNNQQDLYADITGGGNIADTLCSNGGGTNYDAGLTRSAALLNLGREMATKEIYFISDGKPNGGQDGIAIASNLKMNGVTINGKQQNVTIATVMLAGQDEVLEKFIASTDSTGKPMHAFVAQTAELAKVLTDLSDNEIVGAELRYRAVGGDQFTVLNLLDHLKGFDFVLPSINIDVAGQSEGLEVEYEYWDKHDNRYTTGGKLLWTAISSENQTTP